MHVSYYHYRRMHECLRPAIRSELEQVLSLDNDSALFEYQYLGEKEIGRFLGGRHAIGVSSGTAALQFALKALGIGAGDEVITSAHTYIATLLAISATGATAVLIDVKEDTMLMDPDKIAARITPRTKALLPVHLYGQMADMKHIKSIARTHKLIVVEDACQAHLARFDGMLPGILSDAACYSFFPSKNLGGAGNGGMVVTNNKSVVHTIEALRNPTCNTALTLRSGRTPAFLDWIQIAFLKARMKYVKLWTERKRQIAKHYAEQLSDLPVVLPTAHKKAYHVYRDFVIRSEQRNRLADYLRRKGVATVVHYPTPVHLTQTCRFLGHRRGDFPVTEQISRTALSLPMSPLLTDEEVSYVLKMVRDFYR